MHQHWLGKTNSLNMLNTNNLQLLQLIMVINLKTQVTYICNKKNTDALFFKSNTYTYTQPYLTSLLFNLILRRTVGQKLRPLQALFGCLHHKTIKYFKVQPRQLLGQLQLPTGNAPPRGPGEAGVRPLGRAGPHVAGYLPEIVKTELGGRGGLQGTHYKGVCFHPEENSRLLHILSEDIREKRLLCIPRKQSFFTF